MQNKKNNIFNMVLSAMFLALAMVLPLITGQIREIGNALCPMHLPVILCGFFCGPVYSMAVGLIAPLLRFAIFGMPVVVPFGICMSAELAVYGLVSGLLYKYLPKKKIYIYVSLIVAMLSGRVIWGLMRALFYNLGKEEFSWKMFIAGGFTNAIPGIILQIVLIPVVVMLLKKYTFRDKLS